MTRGLSLIPALLALSLVGHSPAAPAPKPRKGAEALLYVKRVPGRTDKEQAEIRKTVRYLPMFGLDGWLSRPDTRIPGLKEPVSVQERFKWLSRYFQMTWVEDTGVLRINCRAGTPHEQAIFVNNAVKHGIACYEQEKKTRKKLLATMEKLVRDLGWSNDPKDMERVDRISKTLPQIQRQLADLSQIVVLDLAEVPAIRWTHVGGFSQDDSSMRIVWAGEECVSNLARCDRSERLCGAPCFPTPERRKTLSQLNAPYEAYRRFMEENQRQRAQRLQRRRELQHCSSPWLEVLENRLVPANPPATDLWVGGISSDWNNAGNWQAKDANGVIIRGGAVPVSTTDVTIDNLNPGCVAPVIAGSGARGAVCASITNQSGTSLTIDNGFALDITGQSPKSSNWGDSKNSPALNVNGKFQVDNLGKGGLFNWANGNITGNGFVYVANGASLFVEKSASNLAPYLSVGKDGINNTNQTVQSFLIISQPNATGNAMAGNLLIGATITIFPRGQMALEADTNQNSTGGIVYAAGNTRGFISVYGQVSGTADKGGQVLTVQPQVIIQSGGKWTEAVNERMKFTYTDAQTDPSVQVGGTFTLLNGANIAVTDPMLINGLGNLNVPSTAKVQTTTATVQGNVNDDGNIQIGDANGFAQLNVTGDVDIERGRLTMWVTFNNGKVTSTDLLNVSGKFSIDTGSNPNSNLTVTTTVMGNPNPPPPGTTVTLVTAGSTATKSIAPYVFDHPDFQNTLNYKKGTLTASSYFLTV